MQRGCRSWQNLGLGDVTSSMLHASAEGMMLERWCLQNTNKHQEMCQLHGAECRVGASMQPAELLPLLLLMV